MSLMADLDILVREFHDIPDDEDTIDYCEKNGLDYQTELEKLYFRRELAKKISERR